MYFLNVFVVACKLHAARMMENHFKDSVLPPFKIKVLVSRCRTYRLYWRQCIKTRLKPFCRSGSVITTYLQFFVLRASQADFGTDIPNNLFINTWTFQSGRHVKLQCFLNIPELMLQSLFFFFLKGSWNPGDSYFEWNSRCKTVGQLKRFYRQLSQ